MFRRLISFTEAKQILKQSFSLKPIGVEHVLLYEAHSRVLAEDIIAKIDVPPFSRSTVDGYAVKAVDTFGAEEDRPVTLRLCGQISAGETRRVNVEKGTTAEIATGAPIPRGVDAVVMLEYAVRKGDTVLVQRPVSVGENMMKAGSDIPKGKTILKEGQPMSSQEIGVLAAIGLKKVNVYKRPKVAVLSTGAEIVEPGRSLPSGKIYDINAHTLSVAVLECGGEPINMGIIPDKKDQLKASLKRALKQGDVVITSGGVSIGPKDLVPQVLDELGELGAIFSGVAVKPGKPTTFAIIEGKPVFSLPGHPTSALLIFHLFVRPAICAMAGKREESLWTIRAFAAAKMFPAKGRRTFVMVNLARDKSGRLLASPVPPGLSGAITTLAKADGFMEIPEGQQFIEVGDEVEVCLFNLEKLTSFVQPA